MAQTYYGILTAVGEAKDANAKALGIPLVYAEMAVGDGNGVVPVPDRNRTSLVHQQRRAPLNSLSRDPQNPNQVIAEQVIPESIGGWYIRELGLYDADGDLVAIANCPETYKPLLAEGSGRVQNVRMVIIVSSADNVQLKVDPSIILATRDYADKKAGDAVVTANNYASQKTADAVATHKAELNPHAQYFKSRSDVLPGGLAKQVLRKKSDAANDWEWADMTDTIAPKTVIPTEKAQAVIYVNGIGLMEWVEIAGTGAFSGYRCPEVGRPEFGSTATPRGYELDMTGGLAPKAAYASLWAWAQQNGHSVTAAVWTTKVFKFADVDATYFRLPDLRDMSARFTGTDADTSTPRVLGSYQADSMRSHTHGLANVSVSNSQGTGDYASRGSSAGVNSNQTWPTGGAETRQANTAFAPRIHI